MSIKNASGMDLKKVIDQGLETENNLSHCADYICHIFDGRQEEPNPGISIRDKNISLSKQSPHTSFSKK